MRTFKTSYQFTLPGGRFVPRGVVETESSAFANLLAKCHGVVEVTEEAPLVIQESVREEATPGPEPQEESVDAGVPSEETAEPGDEDQATPSSEPPEPDLGETSPADLMEELTVLLDAPPEEE